MRFLSYLFWHNQSQFIILSMRKVQFINFLQTFTEEQAKNALEKANRTYNLKPYDLKPLTIVQASNLFDYIQDKFYKDYHLKSQMKWLENELRLFVWCLMCYSHKNGIPISNMGTTDWQYLRKLFNFKSEDLLEYQAKLIVQYSNRPKVWTKCEDEYLLEVMVMFSDKIVWSDISKQLFLTSGKEAIRSSKQCRQRWNNHVDPSKVKGKWKILECLKMFEYVKSKGKRWAQIVRVLDYSRDQHSIKNKFNSIYRKQKRTFPKYTESQIYDQIITKLSKINLNSETGILNSEEQLNIDHKNSKLRFSQIIQEKLMKWAMPSTNKSIGINEEPQQEIKANFGQQQCSIFLQNSEQQLSFEYGPQFLNVNHDSEIL